MLFSDSEVNRLQIKKNAALRRWERIKNREIYVYGGGMCGQMVMHACRDVLGVDPEEKYGFVAINGFLDNRLFIERPIIDSLPVYHPGYPAEKGCNPLVVIALYSSVDANSAIRDCKKYGYEYMYHSEFLSDYVHPCHIRIDDIAYYHENAAELMESGFWADDLSLETYLALLRWRVDRSRPLLLSDPRRDDHYFDCCVPRHYYSHFVDVGACWGDTARAYMARFSDLCERYLAFECASTHFSSLEHFGKLYPQFSYFTTGIWKEKGVQRMFTGPGREESIPVDSLDNLLQSDTVTYLKMDIEGAEPEALQGALGIIRTQRPVMGISIYHTREQLWSIPLWLRQLNLGYKFYCRHYYPSWAEVTCYAIPEEMAKY